MSLGIVQKFSDMVVTSPGPNLVAKSQLLGPSESIGNLEIISHPAMKLLTVGSSLKNATIATNFNVN